MSAYLKRIQIGSVQEVGVDTASTGAYLKRVEIVEVVDSDGNPWEPVPGPDPFDELVVATASRWSNLNDYSPGAEIFGHPATFTGGNPDNTTYRYRWQYKAVGDGNWINSSWTTYNNSALAEISFFIPNTAAGGEVRLHSQARDTTDPENTVQVNSFAPAEDVAYMPLVVSNTTVSGLPYTGQVVTCNVPTVTGGKTPYSYSYMWLDEAGVYSPSNTTTLGPYDLGNIVNCYVSVTSADGQTGTTQTTNGVGPVLSPPVMAPVTAKLNGDVVAQNEAHEVPPGTHDLQAIGANYPPDVQFFWSLRSGTGTLTQDPINGDMATYTTGSGDVGPVIAVTLDSDISESASASWQLFVI